MHVGTITQLQIQQSSLKVGEGRDRHYDPAPIRVVRQLSLDPGGVVGWDDQGDRILDVHHAEHPMSKNRDGDNGISIGFVSHYDLMRSRVGEHLANGLAGENILVETDRTFTSDNLPERLRIERANGEVVELVNIRAAEPCVEFTRFAMRYPANERPDASVTETLEFLRFGMRGYYATYLGAPVTVETGDQVRAFRE